MNAINLTAEEMSLQIWKWLTIHRKTKIALMVAILCTMCSFFNQQAALADDGNVSTFNLPIDHITDSHGVPVSAYSELPLDYGGLTHPARSARGAILGMLWALYALMNYVILAATDFVLGLSWLKWLLAPFTFLAQTVHFSILRLAIVPTALIISAVAASISWMKGYKSRAFLEVLIALVLSAVAVSPLATPVGYLDGDNGAIQKSAEYGSEVGQGIITDKNADQNIDSSPIAASIIDIALRTPAQVISFGKPLDGKCAEEFDNNARDHKSPEDIRKAVTGCDKQAKAANETDSYFVLGYFFIFAIGFSGLWGIVMILLFHILKDSFFALLNGINATWKAPLAVFPWGARYGFYSSFTSMWLNVIMVGASIAVTAVYLWLYSKIVEFSNGTVMIFINFFVGVISLAMAYTLFKMKRRGKTLAQKLSETLSKFGSTNAAPPREPSKIARAVKGFSTAGATYLGSGGLKNAKKGLISTGIGMVARGGVAAATGGGSLIATSAASFVGSQVAKATMNHAANNARNTAIQQRSTAVQQRLNTQENYRNHDGSIPMPAGAAAGSQEIVPTSVTRPNHTPPTSTAVAPRSQTTRDIQPVTERSEAPGQGGDAPTTPPATPRATTMRAGRYRDVRVDYQGKPHTIPNKPVQGEVVEISDTKLNSLKKLDAFDAPRKTTATTTPRFSRS